MGPAPFSPTIRLTFSDRPGYTRGPSFGWFRRPEIEKPPAVRSQWIEGAFRVKAWA